MAGVKRMTVLIAPVTGFQGEELCNKYTYE